MKIDQDWLRLPPVRKVLGAIAAAGGEARFVGGCVRDALSGRPLGDFDLASTLKPEVVMEACQKAGCKVIPTGIDHGTVTVVADHHPFEVTTLRRDVSTDGRHAEVEYTDDWQQDAARSDFTMNALLCDAEGNVTDFFGGYDDLKVGRVRFIGDAENRLREDVLRILRFFRFQAHFGQGELDEQGLAACRKFVSLLPTLSIERVQTELLKLLKAPNPQPVWRIMAEIGVFKSLSLPLENLARLETLVAFEQSLGWPDPLRRLWAASTAEVVPLLRLSTQEKLRIKALNLCPTDLPQEWPALAKLAYFKTVATVADWLVISLKADEETLSWLESWQRPRFPLGGGDLKAMGLNPGPQMGETLHSVETWWVENNFSATADECRAQAQSALMRK